MLEEEEEKKTISSLNSSLKHHVLDKQFERALMGRNVFFSKLCSAQKSSKNGVCHI